MLATYRVQLNARFGFADAAGLAGYLAQLGVGYLYCSPYLQAAAGSNHGYDVVDHGRVNRELGGDEGRVKLAQALDEAGMGQVVDVVPNHMAIGSRANRWWWDVLENGPASRYARYFDVDWDPPERKLKNRVLMAILGDHYGRIIEAGGIEVERREAEFVVVYEDHQLPLAPTSLKSLLMDASHRTPSQELESLAAAFGRLPGPTRLSDARAYERHRDSQVLKARLTQLLQTDGKVRAAVDEALAILNHNPDAVDRLLEEQSYRLAFWRTAIHELDYRRFFDIDTLVGLRMEEPEVFQACHALILEWVADGSVQGLRIDHPDGLRDPESYLQRLAERAPGAWMVVEKILERGERLPSSWPVAGTTGYDFLNCVTGLLVDPAGEPALTELYRELTGEAGDWPALVLECKYQVLREVLAADLRRLTEIFVEVCERHRRYRDYTRHELSHALREVLVSFPVYRTYIGPGGPVRGQDLGYVEAAVQAAVQRRPDLDPELFGFLKRLLLLQVPEPQGGGDEPTPPEEELAMRFQQLSGPVMAKGVEDTAFYRFHRLVALNEVGGDPGHFGVTPEEFHQVCSEAQAERPLAMLATSTHDTKRSEDVRARIALLSEVTGSWGRAVRGWMEHNDTHRSPQDPVDRNVEYLLYQVLVGAWPLSRQRAQQYLSKATKEAKVHTSWVAPDERYDDALARFLDAIFADGAFQASLEEFVRPLILPGRVNSLSQLLLKLTAPGVPDLYQGSELWDLSLVDPDNRRPVDFDRRRRLLAKLDTLSLAEVMERIDEGLPKLLVVRRALDLRGRMPEAFGARATYLPLEVTGERAAHLVGFQRSGTAVTLVPRLVMGIRDGWGDTQVHLPEGTWSDLFTGESLVGTVPAADALGRFPVALLKRDS